MDCRKRWYRMKEGGALDELKDDYSAAVLSGISSPTPKERTSSKTLTAEQKKLILIDGYEFPKVGNDLIRIPIEPVLKEPFYRLGDSVKPYRFASEAKAKGWTTLELITLQEGYEQYGARWDKIARILRHRSPRQCIKQILRMSVNWNKNLVSSEFPSLVDINVDADVNADVNADADADADSDFNSNSNADLVNA